MPRACTGTGVMALCPDSTLHTPEEGWLLLLHSAQPGPLPSTLVLTARGMGCSPLPSCYAPLGPPALVF